MKDEEERILDHRGMQGGKEYLVWWICYDQDDESWIKAKDVTTAAVAEYKRYLKNKDSPHSQLHNTHIRTMSNDLINSDKQEDT
jgi:hypothetical protein